MFFLAFHYWTNRQTDNNETIEEYPQYIYDYRVTTERGLSVLLNTTALQHIPDVPRDGGANGRVFIGMTAGLPKVLNGTDVKLGIML